MMNNRQTRTKTTEQTQTCEHAEPSRKAESKKKENQHCDRKANKEGRQQLPMWEKELHDKRLKRGEVCMDKQHTQQTGNEREKKKAKEKRV